jgi:tRNA(Ile)-lysidine synthase
VTESSRSEAALRRLERRASGFVAAQRLFEPGQRALLLLSGGADSMALLALVRHCDAMLGLGLTLGALHVDYAMRGADSDRDREIVRAACEAAGIRLDIVRPEGPLAGPDFQERARRLRLTAAGRLLDRGAYDVAATGHNRDDQAETVLYRLVKYGAPSALAGMPPRSGRIVRPLLCLRAAEVRDYCAGRGIAYGDDYTNAQETYARNVVRLAVLPQLERINPRAVESLAAAAEAAGEQQELLAQLADEAWRRAAAAPLSLDLAALEREPAALRTLLLRRLALQALGEDALLTRRVTEGLAALAARRDGTQRLRLSGEWEAIREYGRLTVRHAAPASQGARSPDTGAPLRVTVPAPGATPITADYRGRRLVIRQTAGGRPEQAAGRLVLGSDVPVAEITLRPPVRGDRFVPLGMAAETSLARFLREQKVPSDDRARVLVVELGDRVAWVEVPSAAAAGQSQLAGRVAQMLRVTQSSNFTVSISEQPDTP